MSVLSCVTINYILINLILKLILLCCGILHFEKEWYWNIVKFCVLTKTLLSSLFCRLINEQKHRPKRSSRLEQEETELPSITDIYHTYNEVSLSSITDICQTYNETSLWSIPYIPKLQWCKSVIYDRYIP